MRVVIIVIDSGGIGDAPDAQAFGDGGANTIGHAAAAVGGVNLPHLASMGLTRLTEVPGTEAAPLRGVAYAVHPQAKGKDTLAGHWEMMGVTVQEPFRTFPHGFPAEVVSMLEERFGRPLLGNEPASGTEIIARLGPEHLKTGYPIVYTSADSVLQIAAHEEVVPLEELYRWCELAREVMQGPYLVGRIIARPFRGEPGHFVRTPARHDYPVAPPWPTMVDRLAEAGVTTVALGKIGDIFAGRGFAVRQATVSNRDGLEKTREWLQRPDTGQEFIFLNLVEFDSHYGHRRDPAGYAAALKALDEFLPELWARLSSQDQLWVTADHGCDPTYRGTDHTRETVPWLAYGPRLAPAVGQPREGLQDMAATLGALFHVPAVGSGQVARELVDG
ncbi:MAG: phosphopentomutase [Firmicutes bacterium]|nr:phosphopentomutase [Bacillota bacterium]